MLARCHMEERTPTHPQNPEEEATCAVCNEPLMRDARETSVDENGQAVHVKCYVDKIIAKVKDSQRPT